MAVILGLLMNRFKKAVHDSYTYADPLTIHLPMVLNPVPVLVIVGAYLYFVISLGPRLMRNRRGYDFPRVMMVYNAVQVLWCAYLLKEGLRVELLYRYSLVCQPFNPGKDDFDYAVAFNVWLYFVLKIVDLLDTVFMVLRKNSHQISFLHVYHHAIMVLGTWGASKIYPGGHHVFLGYMNCLVHLIMYSYYFWCLVEPRTKAAWWKKYITVMQIVQFGLNALHEFIPLIMPSCGVSKTLNIMILIQNLFMFALFAEFYYKAYIRKADDKTDKQKKT